MGVLFQRGGTTEATAALGYQILALASPLGALVCGVFAVMLRKRPR